MKTQYNNAKFCNSALLSLHLLIKLTDILDIILYPVWRARKDTIHYKIIFLLLFQFIRSHITIDVSIGLHSEISWPNTIRTSKYDLVFRKPLQYYN